MNYVIRMRDDLAEQGLSVPASRTFESYDTMIDVTYITAEELKDATQGNDPAEPDDHAFWYIQLKDGRSFYFLSVDLDFDDADAPRPPTKWIVINGNPIDGYKYYGEFTLCKQAHQWGNDYFDESGYYIAELINPQENEE